MSRQKNETSNSDTLPPGRLYSFLVLLLATVVSGLSLQAVKTFDGDTTVSASSMSEANAAPAAEQHTETLPVERTESSSSNEASAVAENSRPAHESKRQASISSQELLSILGIACLVGFAGMFPSRNLATGPGSPPVDAQAIAQAAQLPLLASVLRDKPHRSQRRRRKTHWLNRFLSVGESILCVAAIVAIYGSLTGDSISDTFLEDPFAAYIESVQHAMHGLYQLTHSSTPVATPSS